MEIGQRLKELRIESKMTLKEVANIIGVKFQQVSKWENNITRPEYENLVSLSKIYGVTTDFILGVDYDYNFEYQHDSTKLIHREKKPKT